MRVIVISFYCLSVIFAPFVRLSLNDGAGVSEDRNCIPDVAHISPSTALPTIGGTKRSNDDSSSSINMASSSTITAAAPLNSVTTTRTISGQQKRRRVYTDQEITEMTMTANSASPTSTFQVNSSGASRTAATTKLKATSGSDNSIASLKSPGTTDMSNSVSLIENSRSSSTPKSSKIGRPKGSVNKKKIDKADDLTVLLVSTNSKLSAVTEASPLPFTTLEKLLDFGLNKTSEQFKNVLELVGLDRMPPFWTEILFLTCKETNKLKNMKCLLNEGFRMDLYPPSDKLVIAMNSILMENKFDFVLPLLLDMDPVGLINLLSIVLKDNPESTVILKKFKASLQKFDKIFDLEAIQLAAETAAEVKSLELFQIVYESGLMTRMVSMENLLNLFSILGTKNEVRYAYILKRIIQERQLIPPFELNILSFAAVKGNYDFLDAVEPCLNIFSWEFVIQAITLALKGGHLSFAEILLRSSGGYNGWTFAFNLVSLANFEDVLGMYADSKVLERVIHAVRIEGKSMILSDLSIMKIHIIAAKTGNIDAIEYLINTKIISIDTRFDNKSIFRIALESKQFNLARYMIKVLSYNINDSDSFVENPNHLGGDSLICVTDDSSFEMFSYLLRIGANPNVRFKTERGELVPLIYFFIKNGQIQFITELLKYNCTFDIQLAMKYNSSAKRQEVSRILKDKQSNHMKTSSSDNSIDA